MAISSRGSVSGWLAELKAGHELAAQQLWNRYFASLLPLARRRLCGLARDVDEEDIVLSALKSAMLGVRNNQFPNLCDRGDLWPLLVIITARKAIDQIKRQCVQKRAHSREVQVDDVESFIGTQPSPGFVVEFVDLMEKLVLGLDDKVLRKIVDLKLQGYTTEEVAAALNISKRTVDRKLRRIRQEWEEASLASA